MPSSQKSNLLTCHPIHLLAVSSLNQDHRVSNLQRPEDLHGDEQQVV